MEYWWVYCGNVNDTLSVRRHGASAGGRAGQPQAERVASVVQTSHQIFAVRLWHQRCLQERAVLRPALFVNRIDALYSQRT